MACRWPAASTLPPATRFAATSDSPTGRHSEAACVVPQFARSRRFYPYLYLAVGQPPTWRSLSPLGHLGRAGFGENRALKDVAGAGRSQRRIGPDLAA